jgi:hypothetical protein
MEGLDLEDYDRRRRRKVQAEVAAARRRARFVRYGLDWRYRQFCGDDR